MSLSEHEIDLVNFAKVELCVTDNNFYYHFY